MTTYQIMVNGDIGVNGTSLKPERIIELLAEYQSLKTNEGLIEELSLRANLVSDHSKFIAPSVIYDVADKANRSISIKWGEDDVQCRAMDQHGIKLSSKGVADVLNAMKTSFDATVGINWDVIDAHIYNVTLPNSGPR
jgi:hypothetical protein